MNFDGKKRLTPVYNVQRAFKPWMECPKEVYLKKFLEGTKDLELRAQKWVDSLRLTENLPTLISF